MDREELIRYFVKENLSFMLESRFPEEIYRKNRKQYFLERHRKSGHGVVSNKVIARAAVSYLIEMGKIDSEEKLREILHLPFFKKYVKSTGVFIEEIRIKDSISPSIDLGDMSELEYRQKLLDQAKQKVIKEETSDIEKAIAKKIEEYETLPSVLDGPGIEEPHLSESKRTGVDDFNPWWMKLHMVDDPFPNLDGLGEMSEEFYEAIIYKTSLFKKYHYIIETIPESIMKNTIFFGLYGSGKTTLFEYLHKHLWNRRIPAIYLRVFSSSSVDELIRRFKYELERELRLQLSELVGHINDEGARTIEDEIAAIFRKYVAKESPLGFVVFIDDLHKIPEYSGASLDFLNYLQLFTANIKRAVPGLRVSFMVAGAMEWYETVTTHSRYSGSFSKWEVIEEVLVDDAHSMLNLRLAPFWPNPELKREVKRQFVEKELKDMADDGIDLTYRDFIRRVQEKFQRGEFNILSAEPQTFTPETKDGIRRLLEEDKRLKEKFDYLLAKVQNNWNLRKSIKQLIHIFLNNGIEDNAPRMRENLFHYQQLRSAQLIQKRKVKDNEYVWVTCKELVERNEAVKDVYSVSLQTYLEPVYCEVGPEPVETDEETDLIEELIGEHSNEELKKLLERTKRLHLEIVAEQRNFMPKLGATELVGLCANCLETLSTAYFTHIDPIEIVLDPIRQWSQYWFFPSETRQFLRLTNERAVHVKRINPIVHMYRQTYSVLLGFIARQSKIMKEFPVVSGDMTRTESFKMRELKEDWMANRFNRCASKLESLVWERITTHLNNFFVLQFGSIVNHLPHLPSEIKERLIAEMKSGRIGRRANPYHKLSLTDLAAIMADTSDVIAYENWTIIFSHVLGSYKDGDLLELIHETDSMPDFHLRPGTDANKLRGLIWSNTNLLRSMNRAYIEILSEGTYVKSSGNDRVLYLSFDSELHGGPLPVSIDCDRYEKMRAKLTSHMIPLDEMKIVEEMFGYPYREVMAFLGAGLKAITRKECKTQWQLQMTQVRGPNIAVRVQETSASEEETQIDVAEMLEEKLRSTKRGRTGWRDYEEVCISILNYVLEPFVFIPPHVQTLTNDGRERRDAVYRLRFGENPSLDQIQTLLKTMFIVVECKNLKAPPRVDDVRQLGDYLNVDANRSWGILCSRSNAGKSALSARKKLWRGSKKLVTFLSDKDLASMLNAKAKGLDPLELLLKDMVEFFKNITH